MNTTAKVFTGAVALLVTASAIFTPENAAASPRDQDRYWGDRYDNGRIYERYDRNNRRYNRPQVFRNNGRNPYYGGRLVDRLPNGCRRVVHRNRVYYTRDNTYYTYNSLARAYMLVNFPGINLDY